MRRKLTDTAPDIASGGRAETYWIGQPVRSRYSDKGAARDDIDLYSIMREYSLKGFEFGNWLNNDERHDHAMACRDALRNLSWVMKTNNIGMDSMVGIAFGARGRNSAMAHYEPHYNMINLTKEHGSTSLAHEYGHALDWNFGRYIDQNAGYNWLTGGDSVASRLPACAGGQFRHYANAIVDTVKKTRSYFRLKDEGEYWHRRCEIFARAFEQYVCFRLKTAEKDGATTRYLCKSWSSYTKGSMYLTESDFRLVLPLFDKLVIEFGKYANNKGRVQAMPYHDTVMKGKARKQ